MGLAASQARFLELTSRKSNIEFQGQQINQQRTTLSNVSAGYNEQLMTLSVPTAPSTQDYTKVSYSYTDASGANYEVTSLTSLGDNKYRIDYDKSYTGDTSASMSVKLQYDGGYVSPLSQGAVSLSNVDMTDEPTKQTLKLLFGDDYASTTTTTESYRNSYMSGKYSDGTTAYYNTNQLSSITAGNYSDIGNVRVSKDATTGEYSATPFTINYGNADKYSRATDSDGKTFYINDAGAGLFFDENGRSQIIQGTISKDANGNNTFSYSPDGGKSYTTPIAMTTIGNEEIQSLDSNSKEARALNWFSGGFESANTYNTIQSYTFGETTKLGNVDLSTVEDNSDEAKALQDVTSSGNYNDKDSTTTTTPNSYKYYDYNSKRYYINSNDLTTDKNVTVKSKVTNGTITESGYVASAYIERSNSRLIAYSETDPDVENAKDRVKLTVSTTTDTNAYEDAMNKWTYNKQVYDKTMTDINAKMSIVQQQDKSLELKLRELDTEQQAVSTEMDAVKKVADKNVESTFKTFNA